MVLPTAANFNGKNIRFVDSIFCCNIEGCENEAILLNAEISNGRRCLEHAPQNWIEFARNNLGCNIYDDIGLSQSQIFYPID